MDRPFLGRFDHSLDLKGRIILPARFRTIFSSEIYITPHIDRCLALWTPEAFVEQEQTMRQVQHGSREDRNMTRLWAATSQVLEIDAQGRIAVPTDLRAYAQLEKDVVVNGNIGHVELWNPTSWAASVLTSEERLVDGSGLPLADRNWQAS